VVIALQGLMERDGDPLVVQLPRTPGRKDSEFMHLFSGPVDMEAYAASASESDSERTSGRSLLAELEERVSKLESELASLKELLG
jgi:uncharacterized protein YceH (UPF0502 family)